LRDEEEFAMEDSAADSCNSVQCLSSMFKLEKEKRSFGLDLLMG
jgi:hypothetical protein